MAKIEVTFPKKVSGIGERDRYELEKFVFEADDNKSMSEQGDDAFIEACKRGHNPNKNIRMHWVDGSPVKTADGEDVDLEIHCPNGRKEGAPRPQEKPVTGKIRKNYGFTYESCGTCKGCQYDLSKRTHICNRRGGERIGQNQYAHVCDGWTDSRY